MLNPQVDYAKKQLDFTFKLPYDLLKRNCMHDTFSILTAYGVKFEVAPGNGPEYMFPSIWFYNNFSKISLIPIEKPVDKQVDLTIYWDKNMGYDRFEIYQAAYWKLNSWSDNTSSMILRRGYLRLFKGENYSGEQLNLKAPISISDLSNVFINGQSYNFDDCIKSLIISDKPFVSDEEQQLQSLEITDAENKIITN